VGYVSNELIEAKCLMHRSVAGDGRWTIEMGRNRYRSSANSVRQRCKSRVPAEIPRSHCVLGERFMYTRKRCHMNRCIKRMCTQGAQQTRTRYSFRWSPPNQTRLSAAFKSMASLNYIVMQSEQKDKFRNRESLKKMTMNASSHKPQPVPYPALLLGI
jgi:hypothetical protein